MDLLPYFNGNNDRRTARRRSIGDSASRWRFAKAIGSSCATTRLPTACKGLATDAKLYNLANDIGESKDLIRAEPQKAKALQAAWDEWNELNVAPLWGDAAVTKNAAGQRARRHSEGSDGGGQ